MTRSATRARRPLSRVGWLLACGGALGAVLTGACVDGRHPGTERRAEISQGTRTNGANGKKTGIDTLLPYVASSLSPRNVTRTSRSNEANPRFSFDGRYLAFERRDGSAQAIFVTEVVESGTAPVRISSRTDADDASEEDVLLGGEQRDESFNTELSFLPDGSGVVFTGNAGTGVYRLYRGRLDPGERIAEPITGRSSEDGHPAVSPNGRWLAYVSARDGVGKLFLRDLETGQERQLTRGSQVDLHPVWSPDSRSLAFTSGSNDNHDVFLVPDVLAPEPTTVPLTVWTFDDLRPTYSPDGEHIAFYSNFSPTGDEEEWSIVVVPADGSGPMKGMELARKVAATNVVKDSAVGPAWLPRGRGLVFARNLKEEWNPIYVVDLDAGREVRIETRTRMNHDLTCSSSGLLAFRAQVGSWDDIFVAPLVRVP